MRESWALVRSAWLTESSYRLNMVLSVLSVAFIVVPLYFVGHALQPLMSNVIASQSREYFSFALVGALALSIISASVGALPTALASALARGTFESYLATPTPVPRLLVGLSAYGVIWALVRGVALVAAGIVLGVQVTWSGVPATLLILALLLVAYGAVGLIGAGMLLYFRTTGPFLTGVVTASALLGGVYYPTHVIPSWLQEVSRAVPLSYGLRALRQVSLLGAPFRAVAADVGILAAFAAALLIVGSVAISAGLRHSRRGGSLSHS